MLKLRRFHYGFQILILATVYLITGNLGLSLVSVHEFAPLAWPPTGISLAALLLFGPRLWPGIALGAVAFRLSAGASLPTALTIATGNTAGVILGTFLLRRYFDFHNSLDRARDILWLVLVAVLMSAPLSATMGTLSVWSGHLAEKSNFVPTWLAWWMGDGLSCLLFTPFFLVWGVSLRRTAELRSSEERCRLLVETVQDYSIFMLDPQGRIVSWNEGAKKIFGYHGTEVVGQQASKLYPKEDLNSGKAERDLRIAALQGRFDAENWRMRKDGSRFLGRVTITALKNANGAFVGYSIILRDITEAKRLEEERHKNLSVLTAITESTSDAIFIKDLEGRYQMANSVTARLIGVPMDRVIGSDDTQLFPAEIATRLRARDRAVIESGRAGVFEEEFIFQGETRILLVNKSPFRNTLGKITGVIGITQDITERKRDERVLQESKNQLEISNSTLHATLESTADGILVVDRHGKIESFNQRFLDLWRIPESVLATHEDNEVLAAVLIQLKNPEDFLKKVRELYNNSAEESSDLIDFKDGRVFERYSRPQRRNREIIGRVWSFRDITEQKKMADELKLEKEKFRSLFELGPDPTIIVDERGIIELFNDRAEFQFGYSRAEVIGQSVDILVPQRFRLRGTLFGDLRARRKDGSEFPIEVSVSPLRSEHLVSSSVRDISERHAFESERAELLRRERSARVEAEQATHMRDELVAMVSHDLKNPLAGILIGAQLIRKSNWINGHGKRLLEIIVHQAEQMNRMIQDLLDVHKIEASYFDVQSELGNHDVLPIVQDAVEAQQILANDKNIRIEMIVSAFLPMVRVNSIRIQQVFQNLLGNAIKFTPIGGLVRIKAEVIGLNVVFSIQDSGPGIEEDLLPRLFERFTQAKKTADRGTGLGLMIAKGIVESHGGRIWVASRPGEGSIFYFTVPVAKLVALQKTS